MEFWVVLKKNKTQCSIKACVKPVLVSSAKLTVTGKKGSDLTGNVQAKGHTILLTCLDIRAVSILSNQYGTVPGLISSISLIRPGRMLC